MDGRPTLHCSAPTSGVENRGCVVNPRRRLGGDPGAQGVELQHSLFAMPR